MARKARQRITYVLPLTDTNSNSPGGHRLGVNGLAVDPGRAILYSGGRDGLLCAWDLNLDLRPSFSLGDSYENGSQPGSPISSSAPRNLDPTRNDAVKGCFRTQVQAHTHWVNDTLLAQSNAALVSASSDLTVKLWRPHSSEPNHAPHTIGLHTDYVKRLASPESHSDWVASGGLDHTIRLWDLNQGAEKMQIGVGDEGTAKGSVYALSVKGQTMASGGPESIVRLWDSRTGKRITNFVGHTDNVRDILINQDGDMVMTASSDQSIKVWSITAGRCMYTLTMHNDSVWSLYSDHPRLSVFYSSDRSGLVAKTDVRNCEDLDEGLSLAVAQEQQGVNKVVVAGDFFWTATSTSSINRWSDVDTTLEIQHPRSSHHRGISAASDIRAPSTPPDSPLPVTDGHSSIKIPLAAVLRISNNAPLPGQRARDPEANTLYSGVSVKQMSDAPQLDDLVSSPYQQLPTETIEGQHGLIKHLLLNDRRRALTLDTAGEVMMWDLLKCIPVQSFGKRHLDDVRPEVDTTESISNWCGLNTRTGRLAVILEENYCFDAESYVDEMKLSNGSEFREDQRINLGKWVLRHLFARFIDEEASRDAAYRAELTKDTNGRRVNAPPSIQIPSRPGDGNSREDELATPRAGNGTTTPGLNIGVATPIVNGAPHSLGAAAATHIPATINEDANATVHKRNSHGSQPRSSSERFSDYFSANTGARVSSDGQPRTPSEHQPDTFSNTTSPVDGEKDEKSGNSLFGKKFRMNLTKKLGGGRTSTEVRPAPVDEKSEESDKSEEKEDREIQDNLFGTVQKIRFEYDEQLHARSTQAPVSGINPSLLNETPKLDQPPSTTIIIQEERPDSGGVADLYRGVTGSLGQDADAIEKAAPMWLGELLLRNELPPKEMAKVSFILLPYQDLLPSIASADGNTRLNANRMLRAKKVLAYIAERIETLPAQPEPEALKPEEYLELYCQNQLVNINTTLATLRAHIWKTGGDVVLYYKSNGRKPELDTIMAERSAALKQAEASGKVGPSVPAAA